MYLTSDSPTTAELQSLFEIEEDFTSTRKIARADTGKSSICDGIEFALTGSITKYSESSEKGEDVGDYLWWRGAQPAEQKYVTLELVDHAGMTTTITRRPDGVTISSGADLLQLLCDRGVDPEKTLSDVCRTSIIRDELITRMSVDLAEPELFRFSVKWRGGVPPLVSVPPLRGGDFQGIRVYRSDAISGRARKANFRARHRLDEPTKLTLGLVASLQSPLPFHLAKSL